MRALTFLLLASLFIAACRSESDDFNPDKVDFITLGNWDSLGVPNYLCERAAPIAPTTVDNFFSTFTSRVDATLKYPQWFQNAPNNNIVLQEDTDITISFLFEEAENTNILGYYTFPTEQPPGRPNDITDFVILFPNVTHHDENVLLQGDKICLDGFSAGTTVGFFLVVQGWENSEITKGKYFLFSNSEFNEVEENELKQKSLLLYEGEGKLLLTFEALRPPLSDNDFDDAAVVIEFSNPNAIDTSQLIQVP